MIFARASTKIVTFVLLSLVVTCATSDSEVTTVKASDNVDVSTQVDGVVNDDLIEVKDDDDTVSTSVPPKVVKVNLASLNKADTADKVDDNVTLFTTLSSLVDNDAKLDNLSNDYRKPRANNLFTTDINFNQNNTLKHTSHDVVTSSPVDNEEKLKDHRGRDANSNTKPSDVNSTDYTLDYPYENFEYFEPINLADFTLPSHTLNPIINMFKFNESSLNIEAEEVTLAPLSALKGSADSVFSKILNGPDRELLPANSSAEDIYKYLASLVQHQTEHYGTQLLSRIVYTAKKLKVAPECILAIRNISTGITKKQSWALKFLDSSGKFNPNLYHGTLTKFGNFDQCIKIVSNDDMSSSNKSSFSGKYCLSHISPPLPARKPRVSVYHGNLNDNTATHQNTPFDYYQLQHERYSYPIKLGLCVPSVCSPHDVSRIFNEMAQPFNYSMEIKDECTVDSPNMMKDDLPGNAIVIYSFILIFAILGTLFDSAKSGKSKGCFKTILTYFSIVTNSKRLFSLKNQEFKLHILDAPSYQWLHGVQVCALFWLIVSNICLLGGLPITFLLENVYQDYSSKAESILFQVVLNSWDYVAQTFFFISGFVVCISFLKIKYSFPILRLIIYSWCSWIPSIIGVLMFSTIIFHSNWKSGPIFTMANTLILRPCDQKAWTNLIFCANWYSVENLCLPHVWFFSALFQLKVMSFVVIYILKLIPVIGIIFSVFIVLGGLILPAFATLFFEPSPIMVLTDPFSEQMQGDLSFQLLHTYNHVSSYFLGVLIAFKVANRTKKYHTTKLFRLLGWLSFSAISLCSILITFLWNSREEKLPLAFSMLYSSLHRIAWVSGLAWMAHEFSLERGGFLRKFFSLQLFKRLNKLTLQVYLIHLIFIWYLFLTSKSTLAFQNFDLLIITFGVILASYTFGYFNYLLFEAPFKSVIQGFMKFLQSWNLKAKLKEYGKDDNGNHKNPGNDFPFSDIDGCSTAAEMLAEKKMCESESGVVIRL